MQIITLRSHIGQDGMLHLDIPIDVKDTDLNVTVILEPVIPNNESEKPQGKGWPSGFFEETSGCLKDTPLFIDFDQIEDKSNQEQLEDLLLSGLQSGEATIMTADDWQEIRQAVHKCY